MNVNDIFFLSLSMQKPNLSNWTTSPSFSFAAYSSTYPLLVCRLPLSNSPSSFRGGFGMRTSQSRCFSVTHCAFRSDSPSIGEAVTARFRLVHLYAVEPLQLQGVPLDKLLCIAPA